MHWSEVWQKLWDYLLGMYRNGFPKAEKFHFQDQAKKCLFFQHSVVFLGYVLFADVILWQKLRDYLFGAIFTLCTDNNPLVHVRGSKLGVALIQWLSKCVLFDFKIQCRTGNSNKAADALSHCPFVPSEMDSETGSEEHETILYATVCEELENIINGKKLPYRMWNGLSAEGAVNLWNKVCNCTPMWLKYWASVTLWDEGSSALRPYNWSIGTVY